MLRVRARNALFDQGPSTQLRAKGLSGGTLTTRQLAHGAHIDDPPKHGAILARAVSVFRGGRFGEASQHDHRPRRRRVPDSGEQAGAVGLIDAVEDVGEGESVEAPGA